MWKNEEKALLEFLFSFLLCKTIFSLASSSLVSEPRPKPIWSSVSAFTSKLILKFLDECYAQYSSYCAEFYKNNSQKLFKILDAISINWLGKQKLGRWKLSMTKWTLLKASKKLHGLVSVTPEFIKSWSVSGCTELTPTSTQVLLSCRKNRN